MNNYSNMSGQNNFDVRAYEIAEARKRMGLTNNYSSTMTSSTNGAMSTNMGMSSSTTTPTGNTMSNNTTMSSPMISYNTTGTIGTVPSLMESQSIDYSEIQKARQKMNQGSSTSSLIR